MATTEETEIAERMARYRKANPLSGMARTPVAIPAAPTKVPTMLRGSGLPMAAVGIGAEYLRGQRPQNHNINTDQSTWRGRLNTALGGWSPQQQQAPTRMTPTPSMDEVRNYKPPLDDQEERERRNKAILDESRQARPDIMEERGLIKGEDGVWIPSPALSKSVEENYQRNIASNQSAYTPDHDVTGYQRQSIQDYKDRQNELSAYNTMSPKMAAEFAIANDPNANPIHRRNSAAEVAMWQSQKAAAEGRAALPKDVFGMAGTLNTQALEGYKASNQGALQQGQSQQALATAESTRAGLPYVGPMSVAEIAQKKAMADYYSGRKTVDLGTARAKALEERAKGGGQKQVSQKDIMDTLLKIEEMKQTNPEGAAQLRAQLNAFMKG